MFAFGKETTKDQAMILQSRSRPSASHASVVLVIAAISLLSACGGSSSSSDSAVTNPPPNDPLESNMQSDLNALSTDSDFTFIVEAANGTRFSHSTGNSSSTTVYRSASTSKLVTAAIILQLVNDGTLNLDDNPQDYIATWPTTGNLSNIQLRHLLSFTSGLTEEHICINLALSDFETCVNNILAANTSPPIPGDEYYYSSSHMQVAGLMAIEAFGVNSWQQVFEYFRAQTGLFLNSAYDLPSQQNPRLAGGMHWTALDYMDFLAALFEESILTPSLIMQATSDQIPTATITYSPIVSGSTAEDWHYGFGNWIECESATFNCPQVTRISSPGAYGAYPFIDYEHNYFGIVAREGALGTGSEGVAVYREIRADLETWANLNLN